MLNTDLYPNLSLNVCYSLISRLSKSLPWVSLHDISQEDFIAKHKHVVSSGVESHIIGQYLALMYYNNVTSSRGESTKLSSYLNIQDPYEFYCGWSDIFYTIENNPGIINILLESDYEDRKVMMRKAREKSENDGSCVL